MWHLNGTVEEFGEDSTRSTFILETDTASKRDSTYESESAYNKMIWGRHFVVVGMSFECDADKFLLRCLNKIQDEMPVGESRWIIVNPDRVALNVIANKIQGSLPYAHVDRVHMTFSEWLSRGLPELKALGAFT